MRFDALVDDKRTVVNALINVGDRTEQESFLREYSDFLCTNSLRTFHSLDKHLLFHLDGSLDNLKYIFGCIDSSAVYDNYFEGVIAFDVTELLYPRNELAAQYFCERLSDPRYSDHATIVIFVSDFQAETTKRFEHRLEGYIKCKRIDYSKVAR